MALKLPSPKTNIFSAFLLLSIINNLFGQGTDEDYKRAAVIKEKFQKVYHSPTNFTWSSDGSYFWYDIQTNQGREYWKFQIKNGRKTKLFDQNRLASELIKAGVKEVKSESLNISVTEYDYNIDLIKFRIDGYEWTYNIKEDNLKKIRQVENKKNYWGQQQDDRNGQPIYSPDKSQFAFIKNYYCHPTKSKSVVKSSLILKLRGIF